MLRLPAEGVAFAPHIRSAAQRCGPRIDARGDDPGGHAVGAEDLEHVTPPPELLERRRRKSILDLEDTRLALVVLEGAERMERVEARRLDRLLESAAEDEQVQKDVQDLLVLAVSPRRRDGEKGLAVLQDDRRRQRGAGALAAGEHVGALRIEVEDLHTVGERHPGVAGDEGPAEDPAGAWGRGKEGAPRV